MTKQVLSIEQMKNLSKLMPLKEKTDFIWWGKGEGIAPGQYRWELHCSDTADANPQCDWIYPAFTLQDVLGMLPETIKIGNAEYTLSIYPINGKWAVDYCSETGADVQSEECEHLVDAAYSRLCWCIRQGFINPRKEERP